MLVSAGDKGECGEERGVKDRRECTSNVQFAPGPKRTRYCASDMMVPVKVGSFVCKEKRYDEKIQDDVDYGSQYGTSRLDH